jgi:hypothetical protein
VTEIVESTSQTCIEGKIREISRKGCYVDSLNPFPIGTLLNLVISRNQGSFATKGKVIYVHEGFGMGVVFLDPIHDQLEILDYWLAEHLVALTPCSNQALTSVCVEMLNKNMVPRTGRVS